MKKVVTFSLLIVLICFISPLVNLPSEDERFIPPAVKDTEMNKLIIEEDACKDDYEDPSFLNHGEWQLLWHDEFNGNCLDPDKWNVEDWAALKNNELQYYSPNNVKVEDGVLKLISRKERYKGRDYTSGAVHTKDKFEMLYGRVEMRAKLPAGQGMFPAFWMITNRENTWLPEIDIMEMLGHKPSEVWMVVHWLEHGKLTSDSSSFIGTDYSKDFHTFSIEWTPESIIWFIDDVERYRTNEYVPKESMYLYLNTAIGGNWPGHPDQSTSFPALYEIDYVRVYKKN